MGERGAPTGFGSADLDRDYRSAVRARQPGGRGEADDIADFFKVSDDDGGRGIGGEMGDEIGCRQVAFIAGGDDVTEGQTQARPRLRIAKPRPPLCATTATRRDACGKVRSASDGSAAALKVAAIPPTML